MTLRPLKFMCFHDDPAAHLLAHRDPCLLELREDFGVLGSRLLRRESTSARTDTPLRNRRPSRRPSPGLPWSTSRYRCSASRCGRSPAAWRGNLESRIGHRVDQRRARVVRQGRTRRNGRKEGREPLSRFSAQRHASAAEWPCCGDRGRRPTAQCLHGRLVRMPRTNPGSAGGRPAHDRSSVDRSRTPKSFRRQLASSRPGASSRESLNSHTAAS